MKIAIGCDHAGYEIKESLVSFLVKEGYEVVNCGTNSTESVNYPEYANKVSDCVLSGCDFGVLICGSGEGVCMAANKNDGIRCGIGYNDDVSSLIRKHNNANVIAFGARFMTLDEIKKRLKIFLSTEFEGGRHQVRVDMMK